MSRLSQRVERLVDRLERSRLTRAVKWCERQLWYQLLTTVLVTLGLWKLVELLR